MIRLSTCSVLAFVLLLGGCGAPKPPMPSGERIPVNSSTSIISVERNVSLPSRPSVDPFEEARSYALPSRAPASVPQEPQGTETAASAVASTETAAASSTEERQTMQNVSAPIGEGAASTSPNEPVTLQPVSSSVPLEPQP